MMIDEEQLKEYSDMYQDCLQFSQDIIKVMKVLHDSLEKVKEFNEDNVQYELDCVQFELNYNGFNSLVETYCALHSEEGGAIA